MSDNGKEFFCTDRKHQRVTDRIGVIEKYPACKQCELENTVRAEIKAAERKWGINHIGQLPATPKATTTWECSNEHKPVIFSNNAYRLNRFGKPCHECARRRRTDTLTDQRSPNAMDYKALEKETGYRLIGKIPNRSHIPTTWLCLKNHKSKISFSKLKYKGSNCKECSSIATGDRNRKKYDEYTKLASKLNLTILVQVEPKRTTQKTDWLCLSCKLRFRESYHNLLEVAKSRAGRREFGCPRCSGIRTINGIAVSVSQQRIFDMLSDFSVYGRRSQNRKFAGGSFFPDIILKGPGGSKIMIAYDSFAYHVQRENKQKHDKAETDYFLNLGYHVVRIRDDGQIPGRESPQWNRYKQKIVQFICPS